MRINHLSILHGDEMGIKLLDTGNETHTPPPNRDAL